MNITIPDDIWADLEEGTEALLQEWHVREGDTVTKGQVLGVAELVKSSIEILAPADGRVTSLMPAQETFARGAALGRIET